MMGTNEKDEIENKVADGNEAMDVDGMEVGEKALGQEEDKVDNSQKMEVDEERLPVSYDEDLHAKRKEDGKNLVEIEPGDGENHGVNNGVGDEEADADCTVEGVPDHSLEQKGSDKAPLPNETKDNKSQPLEGVPDHSLEEKGSDEASLLDERKDRESQPLESQMVDPFLAEERDGNPEGASNATGMEDLHPHISDKDEAPEKSNNVSEGSEASVQNGTKKEALSNELTSMNNSKEDELKRELKIPKVEEPEKELAGVRLVVCDEKKRGPANQVKEKLGKPDLDRATVTYPGTPPPARSFLGDPDVDGYESGTEEEQREFTRELQIFHKEKGIDFRPPKFYQEQLNLLKLWRWVIKLGGYEQVTSCKLWREVGESFRPPKTCTTISWTFRGFYEKTLLEYEKQKILSGELPEINSSSKDSVVPGTQGAVGQPSGSGRARRDAASRAMQGWHSLRVSSNNDVGDPIIKDKQSTSLGKHARQLKNIAMVKRPKQSPIEHAAKVGHLKSIKSQSETMVVDAGPPADWVKINVHRTKDCYEVYVLVPGLLREEVRVQSDPAGRLVISGQPEHLDNPWGVTPFKKVVSLPSRIDSHQTSAVVTLHGQLFVRVPFEQSDN